MVDVGGQQPLRLQAGRPGGHFKLADLGQQCRHLVQRNDRRSGAVTQRQVQTTRIAANAGLLLGGAGEIVVRACPHAGLERGARQPIAKRDLGGQRFDVPGVERGREPAKLVGRIEMAEQVDGGTDQRSRQGQIVPRGPIHRRPHVVDSLAQRANQGPCADDHKASPAACIARSIVRAWQ